MNRGFARARATVLEESEEADLFRGELMGEGLPVESDEGYSEADETYSELAEVCGCKHAAYTVEARRRCAATTPRGRGTYHAFTPAERAPQRGDIIVQDRRDGITAAQVETLAGLTDSLSTHAEIVVDVQPGFVVTIGGSSRRRRYPCDPAGLLVTDRRQLFTQEDNAGALPALPLRSALPLAALSNARIFALLSPVEECAAVPGLPFGGGILT